MARVYLHIGLEKTGTTTLQAFLTANAMALRRHGFIYPSDEAHPYFERIAHGPLAACLLPERPEFVSAEKYRLAASVLGALRRDIDQAGGDVILSCEQFSSRLSDAAAVRRLADALEGHDVRVICYLRRQDDLAVAAYTTAVRSGRRTPFSIEEVLCGGWYYDFRSMLRLWAEVFGAPCMTVRHYDLAALAGRDIRRDFLALIGIRDTSGFVFGADRNTSLDAHQVEVLRLLNETLPERDETGRPAFERGNHLRSLIDPYLPRGEPLHALLPPEARRLIMARHCDGNREVEATYMQPGALAGWFDPIPDSEAALPGPVHPIELAAVATAMADQVASLAERLANLEHERRRPPSARRLLKDLVRTIRRAEML